MIELWYTTFGAAALPAEVLAAHLAQLPPAWQRKVLGRSRPASRQATLFGALLLQHALRQQPEAYALEQVGHTATNRPYLPGAALDFNVSHSGGYAVCALSHRYRVGIDIEHRTRTSIAAFRPHFGAAEWALMHADDPLRQFYRLWTQKEAVAKADGRGLDIALRDIRIHEHRATLAGTHWHVQEIPLAAAYTLHLASNQRGPVGPPRRVSFEEAPH